MSQTLAPCENCEKLNRVQMGRSEAETPVCGNCKTPLPIERGVVSVNGTLLKKLVDHTNLSNSAVVVDFWGPWCAPCRAFEPEFQRAALHFAEQTGDKVVFAKLNTQEHALAASAYQVRSLPTLILFQNGIETARQFGALPFSVLIQWLKSTLKPFPETGEKTQAA